MMRQGAAGDCYRMQRGAREADRDPAISAATGFVTDVTANNEQRSETRVMSYSRQRPTGKVKRPIEGIGARTILDDPRQGSRKRSCETAWRCAIQRALSGVA